MNIDSLQSSLTTYTHKLGTSYRSLSPEKVIVFWLLIAMAGLLLFAALLRVNSKFLISVPSRGGEVSEGIIGTPRFINPVLAVSDQDKDMVELVYAGLTKRGEDGSIILDMAASITESEDSLHYAVVLKPEARFHDGTPVTADDVIYTVGLIQNPLIKSPHRVEWEGVSVTKQSAAEFTLSLKKPYPLFMNVLTLGILPKHIWKDLTEEQFSLSDYNIHAIGSGPFMIEKINTVSGIPESFVLTSHENYTLGRPYLEKVVIKSYRNEKYLLQAFENKDISRIHGIAPERVSTLNVATSAINTSLLPQTFTVFFNPNKADFLSDKDVRLALNMAINKQALVDTIFKGYGKVIETPYPFDEDQPDLTYDKEKAKATLAASKYMKKGTTTLSITIATANTEEMKKVAEMVKNDWTELGVQAELAVYEVSDLNQSVIKERNFQVLLFGSIAEQPSDLYAFWHSSQRSYPGLNISNYVSSKLDKNLETIRESSDELSRISAYDAVRQEFIEEVPGIFLFAPALVYVTRDNVTSPLPTYSIENASRFSLIPSWYRYTESIWPKTYYSTVLSKIENILH